MGRRRSGTRARSERVMTNGIARLLLGSGAATALGVVLLGRVCGRECSTLSLAHAESAHQVSGATQQVVLLVEGMHCATCPVTVRVTLQKLDGIKIVNVSMKDGKAIVEYDPVKVTPDRMAKAVTDAGYPTRV